MRPYALWVFVWILTVCSSHLEF